MKFNISAKEYGTNNFMDVWQNYLVVRNYLKRDIVTIKFGSALFIVVSSFIAITTCSCNSKTVFVDRDLSVEVTISESLKERLDSIDFFLSTAQNESTSILNFEIKRFKKCGDLVFTEFALGTPNNELICVNERRFGTIRIDNPDGVTLILKDHNDSKEGGVSMLNHLVDSLFYPIPPMPFIDDTALDTVLILE